MDHVFQFITTRPRNQKEGCNKQKQPCSGHLRGLSIRAGSREERADRANDGRTTAQPSQGSQARRQSAPQCFLRPHRGHHFMRTCSFPSRKTRAWGAIVIWHPLMMELLLDRGVACPRPHTGRKLSSTAAPAGGLPKSSVESLGVHRARPEAP